MADQTTQALSDSHGAALAQQATILQRIEADLIKLAKAQDAGFDLERKTLAQLAIALASVNTRLDALEARQKVDEATLQAINQTVTQILEEVNQPEPPPPPDIQGIAGIPGPITTHAQPKS